MDPGNKDWYFHYLPQYRGARQVSTGAFVPGDEDPIGSLHLKVPQSSAYILN